MTEELTIRSPDVRHQLISLLYTFLFCCTTLWLPWAMPGYERRTFPLLTLVRVIALMVKNRMQLTLFDY